MRKILETTAEQEQSSFHHVTDPSMVERQRTSSTNGTFQTFFTKKRMFFAVKEVTRWS